MRNLILSALAFSVGLFAVVYTGSLNYINDDAVNILALLAAALILGITFVVSAKYVNQMKNDTATGELMQENWDDIREYNNKLPVGWAVSFLGTITFAFWYFSIGFPLNAFSQIGQYNEEVAKHNKNFEKNYENVDEEILNEMGESIFLVNCAPCHGITGDGIDGKAADFSRWGSEKGIVDVILHGSKGLGYAMEEMPAGLMDKDNAKAVAAYVMLEISTYGKTANPDLVELGKSLYVGCVGCHGTDGKGSYGTSPDLTKYGTPTFVVDVLERGKKGTIGVMPTYKVEDQIMTPIQQKAVGTYISSLSK